MTLLRTHHGGWNAQRPDIRDRAFAPTVAPEQVPPALALDVSGIPVLDQGQQGSCTGHGTAGIVMFDQKKQAQPIVVPSRAMIYYDARIPEKSTSADAGATVRDAVAGVVKYGVCPDAEFPYSDQVCDLAPPASAYATALAQRALVYEAAAYPHLNETLASGFPIVFGFTVYDSFESDQVAHTGIVPPVGSGEQVLGGHCIWAWGYNATSSPWTAPNGKTIPPRSKACRNSWNGTWGDGGDFYLPQEYFDDGIAGDFWVIRRTGA